MQEDVLRKEIKQIEDNISSINESKETLKEEAKKFLDERNNLAKQSKNMKDEVSDLKNNRNALNQEVRKLKLKREKLRKKESENRDRVHPILNSLTKSKLKIPRNVLGLKAERDKLEWIMQTNPLSRKKEQQLIEQIRNVEKKLVEYDRVNDLEDEISKRRAEIKSLRLQMDSSYEKQVEMSRKSDAYHNEMLQLYSKAEGLRKESDHAHDKYNECLEKLFQIRKEYIQQIGRVKELRNKLYEISKIKSMETNEARKKKTVNYALEKFKKEKKVTLEELKILFKNGKLPKD